MNNTQSREVTVEIAAPPDKVWQAIIDPALTRRYYYGTDILSDWKVGSRWTSEEGDTLYLEGEILEIDAPRRLVQTFHVADNEPAQADPPSKVTWELTPNGNGTQLRLLHEGQGERTADYTKGGWEHILNGLKSVVEESAV